MFGRKLGYLLIAIALGAVIVYGGKDFWKEKPYTEWTQKEVKKMLEDSPWAETYSLSSTSGMRGGSRGMRGGGGAPPGGTGPPSGGGAIPGMGGRSGIQQPPNRVTVTWFSRPIREAMVRRLQLQMAEPPQDQIHQLLNYPETPYYSILMSNWRPARSRDREKAMEEFKEKTYLQTKDKKKIPLHSMIPPRGRGQPLILRFARVIDGISTLTRESKEVTLVTRVGERSLRVKFKFKDMIIREKLEL